MNAKSRKRNIECPSCSVQNLGMVARRRRKYLSTQKYTGRYTKANTGVMGKKWTMKNNSVITLQYFVSLSENTNSNPSNSSFASHCSSTQSSAFFTFRCLDQIFI